MPHCPSLRILLFTIVFLCVNVNAAPLAPSALDREFSSTVRPFVDSYCVGCHSGERAAAQLNLAQYSTVSAVVQDHRHWSLVMEKLVANQMPPKGMKQPPVEQRQKVIAWIDAMRKAEALKNAGDPGNVLARRLSNAEYNYTIRDLTGVDLKPTREFPVDPANPAGFDNSGESLSMSPALANKYLQAARSVANNLVFKPTTLAFAPHPMLVETDRDKYAVAQIIDFYNRQNTNYSDYFRTAWQYKHRVALGQSKATLASLAKQNNVSPKYLAMVWRTLQETKEEIGPLAKLQEMWRALPTPKGNQPELAKAGCDQMRDYVVRIRKKIEPRFDQLAVKGISGTSQPFHIWRNNQYATHRTTFNRKALQVEGEPIVEAAPSRLRVVADVEDDAPKAPARPTGPDPDLQVPAGQRAAYEAAFEKFAAVFPDTFYVRERGRYYPDTTKDPGRLLSAGFHNLMGYYRDDLPLYQLVLNEAQQKELDHLWQELDFIASANIRTFVQFYFNESGEARGTSRESEGPRPADKDVTSERVILQVREAYLKKARPSGNETALKAIEDHFQAVNAGIRWVEQARAKAEPLHVQALLDFAARAYRRPLTQDEREDLLAYYRSLRDKDKLTHEDAIRDCVVSVLMSPEFCYRADLVEVSANRGQSSIRRVSTAKAGAQPLSDYALASRLSYFLWSSMPDEKLLARAASGELSRPAVLAAEVRRMLKDERARGLATEFGANWLDIRRFEELNTVDRERFPVFNNDLRSAMFEEPVRFIEDIIRNDRSILDMLYGNYTFVNPVLAKHYGIPNITDTWVKVDNASTYGRGGLLPMAAFLTKNAPGLRTSPVKRGYWVVKRVLGEEIPPPPAVVPELPRDEAKMDLPLRQMLAKHREDASCASCHARFDSFGLALEGYGPVGERRSKDLAGRTVEDKAEFPGGKEVAGLEGMRAYIREHRQKDFIDNISRKLLVYALGRSLMLSDEPLIDKMRSNLAASNYRFASLAETIVTSPQFTNKRGQQEQIAKR